MAPTSERSFDAGRVQNVTSKREPVFADFSLPELQDLKNLRGPRRQAYDLEQSARQPAPTLGQARRAEDTSDYEYEPLMAQIGAGYMSGGVTPWEPGMGFGLQTAPVALGSRRVRRR